MKKAFARYIACLLAAVMTAVLPVYAGEEEPEGTVLSLLRSSVLEIDDDLSLYSARYWDEEGEAFLAENYYVWTPGGEIRPVISFGNDICGAASYARAGAIEEDKGLNILGGANADFFTFATGTSLGPVVKDGVVCTSEHSSFEEIGFFEDGSAVFGRMGLNVEFTELVTGQVYPLMAYNKDLESGGGLVLYSSVFGPDNNASGDSLNVLIRIDEGEARIGDVIKGTIEEVFESSEKVPIDAEHLLLSVYTDTKYLTVIPILNAMSPEDGVTVSFTCDPLWEEAVNVVGGSERLIRDGELCEVEPASRSPRTAIGVTEDGEVILYTADGRDASHSLGLSPSKLAKRMLELGCVDALNLDGGGSTQLHCVLPGFENDSTVNKPSEDRRCANYIMFGLPAHEAEEPAALFVYPIGEVLLAGSSMSFEARAIDEWHNAAELSEEPVFSSKLGTFEGNVFTAYEDAEGDGRIRASADGLKGSALLTVISGPDSVRVYKGGSEMSGKVLAVREGDSFKFSAEAIYLRLPVIADESAFVWEVSEGMGVIEEDGTYRAEGISEESGILTVSCAGVSASLELSADLTSPVIETSEEEGVVTAFISDNKDVHPAKPGISVQVDGEKYGAWSYSRTDGELTLDLSALESGLHHVIIRVSDAAGNRSLCQLGVETIPPEEEEPPLEGEEPPAKGQVPPEEGSVPPKESGEPPAEGEEPPEESEEAPLPPAFGDMEGHWAEGYARYLQLRGVFSGRGSDEAPLFAPDASMTRQEFATVLIRWLGTDTSLYDGTELPYTDLESVADWALPGVRTAYALGIIEGKSRGEERFFDPNGKITRQEVMTIIGRTLEEGLGEADISAFEDAGGVADWALPYVRVLVGQGIIDGSNGRINPAKSMTRAEAAAVIFRCY